MITPWSIRAHAVTAAKAARRANILAVALCADDRSEHAYCAAQLLAAARELQAAADVIAAKVKAGEGSCLESAESPLREAAARAIAQIGRP